MFTPSPPNSSCSSPPSSSSASCSPPPTPPPTPSFSFSSSSSSSSSSGDNKQIQERKLPKPNPEAIQDTQRIWKLPVGFRYHPNDQEVILHLLAKKMLGEEPLHDINQMNPCEYDPDQLPPSHKHGNSHYYFYYYTTTQPRSSEAPYTVRTTPHGYWKPTSGDVAIFQREEVIGFRKSLVFYRGKQPTGKKARWFMREYRLNPKAFVGAYGQNFLDEIERGLLCRIQHYTDGSDSDESGFGS